MIGLKCFHATHLRRASSDPIDRLSRDRMFPGGPWPGVWIGRVVTFEADGIAYKVDAREPAGRPETKCLVRFLDGPEIVFAVQGSRTARLWRLEQKDRWRLIASHAEAANLVRREVKRLRRMVGRVISTRGHSGQIAIDYSLQCVLRIRPGLEWRPNRRHWYAPGISLRHPVRSRCGDGA